MANTHTTLASLFTDIADKVRKKTGSTTKIVADNLPDAIDNILTPTDGTIITRSSDDLTISGYTATVSPGYYASQISKNVDFATQNAPEVSINPSSGLITAIQNFTTGWMPSGRKTATLQLTTQAAKTITPSTSEQTAVSASTFTTGAVKVAAIPSEYKKLPSLTNPASAADIANGYQAIDANGNKVIGTAAEITPNDGLILSTANGTGVANHGSSRLMAYGVTSEDLMIRAGTEIDISVPNSDFGDATAEDVVAGKTFTSAAGLKVTGTGSSGAITITNNDAGGLTATIG